MKHWILILGTLFFIGFGASEGLAQQAMTSPQVELILREIRDIKKETQDIRKDAHALRQDMNLRFQQVDKRFEFMQQLMIALLAAVFASPFIVHWLWTRREQTDQVALEDSKRLVMVMRFLSHKDERIREAMQDAHLL